MQRRRIISLVVSFALALGVVSLAAGPAGAGDTERFVVMVQKLLGEREVPDPGDPDGKGFAVIGIVPDKSKVCWVIIVEGITLPATAAHIHEAPEGVPGPIVVTLSPPTDKKHVFGCTEADPGTIESILATPDNFYVNVHTSDFSGGAVRGQLTRVVEG